MKDARVETKHDSPGLASGQPLASSLGGYESFVSAALNDAAKTNVIQRLWAKDASLWKQEEMHQKIICNALGWLTAPAEMLEAATDLKAFADGIRADFEQVMVCGMGGSSLCPEVLRQTFGQQEGYPKLLVLDSTDPDVVSRFAQQIEIEHCVFIIASKSGTTTEPLVFHKYWYEEVAKRTPTPGKAFVAITDPRTALVNTAREHGFKQIFQNQPDIGGRYSALSYFGMVPAALMGLDTGKLLNRAKTMAESCSHNLPAVENPAARLGAIMAECAKQGRDKLTIVTDQKLSALGLWIEQLVAESTGKEGKGIVPVVREQLGAPSVYGSDRLFVSISIGVPDDATMSKLKALEKAGQPVVYRNLNDLYDLGAEFFLWEMATAFVGWRLGINPFDQPNVQESKDATKALLAKFSREGKLQDQRESLSDGTIKVYPEHSNNPAFASVKDALHAHLARVKPGDYLALLDYIEETDEIEASLQAIRMQLRDATRCATTTGYGPRFLHSTGQLHKGGPDSGVFIQITAADKVDLAIPGEPYTFSVLKQAQALGDFQSLLSHGRRAIQVDLGNDVLEGLRRLKNLISEGLPAGAVR